MAILNVKLPTNLTEYPNSFKRQGSFPLEAYSVFYAIRNESGAVVTSALDAAKDYAKNNPISYVGQILAVVDVDAEGASSVQVYKIENANGDLVPVSAGSEEVADLLERVSELETLVGSAGLLKREIVEALPEKTEADVNTIYMVKATEGGLLTQDVYEEYMLINGEWEVIGNTRVDLSNYATKEDLKAKADATAVYTKDEANAKIEEVVNQKINTENNEAISQLNTYKEEVRKELYGDDETAEESRLDKLEKVGAQANVIEKISTPDGELAIDENKGVTLPIATAQKLGLVKSSTGENKIEVANDGTMSVHSLNVNKLTQTAGEYLILNGGGANLTK